MFDFSTWNIGDWLVLLFALMGAIGMLWQILRTEGLTYAKSLNVIIGRVEAPKEAEERGEWFFSVEVEPGNPQPLYDARIDVDDETTLIVQGSQQFPSQSILMLEPRSRHLRMTYVAHRGVHPRLVIQWWLPSKIRRRPVLQALRYEFSEKMFESEGHVVPVEHELHWKRFQRIRKMLNRILRKLHIGLKFELYVWKEAHSHIDAW